MSKVEGEGATGTAWAKVVARKTAARAALARRFAAVSTSTVGEPAIDAA